MSILEKAIPSFEETYKTSYSHGLEEIYALETVNLASVRKIIQEQPEIIAEEVELSAPKFEGQLELDLGPEFRNWIEPFFLGESIKVLGLSQGAEKCLIDHQKRELRDLIQADLKQFVLGQGHIDEIRKKLGGYLAGRSTEKSYRLEMGSWLRAFFSKSDRKRVSISLAEFGLEELMPLSNVEKAELKQVSQEVRLEWVEELKQECRSRFNELNRDVEKMVEVFILPWIRGRSGLVRKRELRERILRVSDEQKLAENMFSFMTEVCFGGEFPFGRYLLQLERDLYCSDPHVGTAYVQIVERAISYFYNPALVYKLPELTAWLQKEFLKDWNGYNEELIEKALRLSSHFRVRKGSHGVLEVRLA